MSSDFHLLVVPESFHKKMVQIGTVVSGGHLIHVTKMPRTNFRSLYPRRLHIKFGFDRASDFGEEDV